MWDMGNAIAIADAAILVLNKPAGGAFGNLTPHEAGANATAQNTARGANAAWSTAFLNAVQALADAERNFREAEWQWHALKLAVTGNIQAQASNVAKVVNAVIAADGVDVTIATSANANGALTATLDTANKALLVGQARTALAQTNLDNAKTNKARAAALLAILNTERLPLAASLAVLEWQRDDTGTMANSPTAALAKATADYAKYSNADFKAGLAATVAAAKLAMDRAVESTKYFTEVEKELKLAYDDDSKAKVAGDGVIAKAKADIQGAEAMLATSVAACKGAAYGLAQVAMAARDKAVTDNKATAAKVKTDYEAAAAFPAAVETDGKKVAQEGSLCAFPAKGADGAQAARPVCKEELCCGAAQRFLKDGTKLTVETCQKKTAHTYKYYPPLPAGAIVAPETELWRFQCISGAQKLVAAATAALAASYMMA